MPPVLTSQAWGFETWNIWKDSLSKIQYINLKSPLLMTLHTPIQSSQLSELYLAVLGIFLKPGSCSHKKIPGNSSFLNIILILAELTENMNPKGSKSRRELNRNQFQFSSRPEMILNVQIWQCLGRSTYLLSAMHLIRVWTDATLYYCKKRKTSKNKTQTKSNLNSSPHVLPPGQTLNKQACFSHTVQALILGQPWPMI